MPVTGLELPFGVKVTNPVPVDPYFGPFDSLPNALAAIPAGVRYVGREFGVVIDGNAITYQFFSGILNADVVQLDFSQGIRSIATQTGAESEIDLTDPLNPKIPPRALPFSCFLVQDINWSLSVRDMQGEVNPPNVLFINQDNLAENGFKGWTGSLWVPLDTPALYFANDYNRIYTPTNGTNVGKLYFRNRVGNYPAYHTIGVSNLELQDLKTKVNFLLTQI